MSWTPCQRQALDWMGVDVYVLQNAPVIDSVEHGTTPSGSVTKGAKWCFVVESEAEKKHPMLQGIIKAVEAPDAHVMIASPQMTLSGAVLFGQTVASFLPALQRGLNQQGYVSTPAPYVLLPTLAQMEADSALKKHAWAHLKWMKSELHG